jgi:hypothetical protein
MRKEAIGDKAGKLKEKGKKKKRRGKTVWG